MPIVSIPKILLPKVQDMSKWAVVACDQFTAEPSYWRDLYDYVGDAPSALNIVYPEIFLSSDTEKRIDAIVDNMNTYIRDGLFSEREGLILVERTFESGNKRVGLMVQIDLESYDFNRVRVPIRATEDTLLERIPVRVKIRRDASVELPHTLLLIDDRDQKIIEPLYEARKTLPILYDFPLNMGGGRIKGYAVENGREVIDSLMSLLDAELQTEKYGADAGILFAVGDGNHSIAAAKTLWEEKKKTMTEAEKETSPARYFLAEVVNVYGGAEFEPIHRVVYGYTDEFIRDMKASLSGEGQLTLVTGDSETVINVPKKASLAISAVQSFLERAMKTYPIKVDYVHNLERLKSVVKESGALGIIMPRFPRSELFDYVVNVGNLPKKSFSIGEPEEKRYYLEAKYIK